ncbi:MAG: hypothetical protein MUF31_13155 [Akkermansiaceae bacterium]|jgi:hypothetical protein|nr:hypothetical protein [Akkermansiaceae bacterium]
MNLYRTPIALFGFVLPVFITAALAGVAFIVKSRIENSFNEKLGHFQGYEQNRIQALAREAENSKKRQFYKDWETLLAKETASSVGSTLATIEDKLPSKEFQVTTRDFPANRAGFASVSAQNSGQVHLAFRATFRSMQLALLELETRMPHLQLQEFRIDPSANSNSLNFDVFYTAWEP